MTNCRPTSHELALSVACAGTQFAVKQTESGCWKSAHFKGLESRQSTGGLQAHRAVNYRFVVILLDIALFTGNIGGGAGRKPPELANSVWRLGGQVDRTAAPRVQHFLSLVGGKE